MGFIERTKEFFGLSSTHYKDTSVSASADSTKTNPIVKSLEDLNGRWRKERTEVGDYIKFGRNDDIPEVLDKLKMQSPTHSGIVTKKSKMVTGNSLTYDEGTVARGEKTRFEAFFRNAEGLGRGVEKLFGDAAYSYEHYGAVPIYIKYDKSLKRIVQMKVLNANSVRCGIPDMDGEIPYFIVRRTFKRSALQERDNKPRRIPAWNPRKPVRESIYYYKNPRSNNPVYGVPDYLSAYFFITADFEFGQMIANSATNGFSPKVLATFVGRNMTQEQKDDEFENFKGNFTGSAGEQVILSWVRKKEDAPEYTVLDVKNLDRTVDVMAKLNDSKILTAHNVTSPQLFGIAVSGKLGGTGEEIISSYYIFRATETLPNRKIHLNSFNYILEKGGYGKVELNVTDISIDPDSQTSEIKDSEETKDISNE